MNEADTVADLKITRLNTAKIEADTVADLKIIRLSTAGIDEPNAPYAVSPPYKLTTNFRPPDFGSKKMIVRGRTRVAREHFIEQPKLTQETRLHSLMIMGPDGVTEEILQCPR
jgi:hypothetical protein